MKKLLPGFLLFCSSLAIAQPEIKEFGGEYKFAQNATECVSDAQRAEIFAKLESSRQQLRQQNLLPLASERNTLVHPLFVWPVVKNPTVSYNNTWSISNHVDHNPLYPNYIQDYSCGTRSYDTAAGYNHKGIDIYTWPFTWHQFQNNHSWAVAAADGVIVYKETGNFDMNCSLNGTDWNAVYIDHADGSTTWYGHLKNGSLTTKFVGQPVVAGEYLGTIGSSGNSTGPHLHFETYNSFNQLVDPYSGACNTWASSTDSWWAEQKPYNDPKINAVLTHSAPPQFFSCPTVENPNLSDSFTSGSNVIGAIYLADQLAGTSGTLTLTNPFGMVVSTIPKSFTDTYYSSYWYWTFPAAVFQPNGNWTLSFNYLGNTVSHNFSYGSLDVAENSKNKFSVYPNPTTGVLNIQSDYEIELLTISDIVGKKIISQQGNASAINVDQLASGTYIIRVKSSSGIQSQKFIKQ